MADPLGACGRNSNWLEGFQSTSMEGEGGAGFLKVASVEDGFGLSQNLAKGGLLYLFFQLLWPIKNIVYLVGLTSRYLFKEQEFVT